MKEKQKQKKKKKQFPMTLLLVIIFFTGLSLVLYPSIADYVNRLHGSRTIGDYSRAVEQMQRKDYERFLAEAEEYNADLLRRENGYTLDRERKLQYEKLLNVGGDGVMGYIEIPEIRVTLPIYHGTSDNVLQVAVGHLDWTSLPVGGESAHCVLSGHRGLPSASLFTDLDKLVEGDIFMLRVLNEVLTYEIDQILIVSPNNTSDLQITEGKDYCTLVTCTPYGINSHRMLVRGHRVENTPSARSVRITAEAIQIEPMIVAPIIAAPLLLILLILLFTQNPGKAAGKQGEDENE